MHQFCFFVTITLTFQSFNHMFHYFAALLYLLLRISFSFFINYSYLPNATTCQNRMPKVTGFNKCKKYHRTLEKKISSTMSYDNKHRFLLHTTPLIRLQIYPTHVFCFFFIYFRADDSEIEYFPISPHLTRIRVHKHKNNNYKKKPLTFASLKRNAQLASTINDPPSPPIRKSSKYSSALKFCSKMTFSKPYTITKNKMKTEDETTSRVLPTTSNLESPTVVRKIMNDGFPKEPNNARKNPSGTIVKSSTTYYTSGKNQKDDKSLRVTVAISTKGKELLKSSCKKSPLGFKKTDKSEKRPKTFISYIEPEMKTTSNSPSTIVKLAKKTSAENAVRKSKRTVEKTKKKKEECVKKEPQVEIAAPVSYIFEPEKCNQFGDEFKKTRIYNNDNNPCLVKENKYVRCKRKIKSEPILNSTQIYLKSKKPVSGSKFHMLEKRIQGENSYSSYGHTLKFWEGLDKCEYEDQWNDQNKLSKFWLGRSSSEPPPLSNCNEEIENKKISSPSSRKIRNCKSPVKTIEGVYGVKSKSKMETQSRSTSSLNLSQLNDHADYQMYVMELMHSTRKSERFKELKSFYSALERKGLLEKTAFKYDLKPRLKGEEVIDYERWKELRKKEKAEAELKTLYEKLRNDQKYKNLLFCPNDAEQLKWSRERERNLRIKEKSVEDLRQIFHQYADNEKSERKSRFEMSNDFYKPLWRGWSVQDVANNYRNVTSSKRGRPIAEIKRSLSESTRPISKPCDRYIGSKVWSSLSVEQLNALKTQLNEIYSKVSTLKRDRIEKLLKGCVKNYEINVKEDVSSKNLHVRCNSVITQDQMYSPTLKKKEKYFYRKSDSISSLPNLKDKDVKEFSETDKKRISKRLSRELLERMKYGSVYGKKRKKNDLVIPRETLGAVAAIKSKRKSPTPYNREMNISPRTCYSLDMSDEEAMSKRDDKNDFLLVLTPERNTTGFSVQQNKTVSSDTESLSSTASTVIHLGKSSDTLSHKRKFEQNGYYKRKKVDNLYRSYSASDFKEIFGEHSESYQEQLSPNVYTNDSKTNIPQSKTTLCKKNPTYHSNESSLYSRSRSISPDPTKYYRAYLNLTKNGEVKKLRKKFESLEDVRTNTLRKYNQKCKRYRSDPELTRLFLAQRGTNTGRTVIKSHEYGDVKYLKDRYERKYGDRKYHSRSMSPIPKVPFKLEDRLMPHINVISKQSDLLQLRSPSPSGRNLYGKGEVEKLKRRFENQNRMSLMGQLYTSSPDFRELRNISPYLECEWIAHQYPEPEPVRPISSSPCRYSNSRPSSLSPVHKQCSILKQKSYDAFANQRFNPAVHKPVYRYEPPLTEFYPGNCHSKSTTVKFKGANLIFLVFCALVRQAFE